MNLSFKQFLLEYEFHIPPTTYGYWITGNGEFITVQRGSEHTLMLVDMPGMLEQAFDEGYITHKDKEFWKTPGGFERLNDINGMFGYVLSKGWVRIVDMDTNHKRHKRVDINIHFSRLTQKSYFALKAFLADRAELRAGVDIKGIYVDIHLTDPRDKDRVFRTDWKEFRSFKQTIRYINQIWNS